MLKVSGFVTSNLDPSSLNFVLVQATLSSFLVVGWLSTNGGPFQIEKPSDPRTGRKFKDKKIERERKMNELKENLPRISKGGGCWEVAMGIGDETEGQWNWYK